MVTNNILLIDRCIKSVCHWSQKFRCQFCCIWVFNINYIVGVILTQLKKFLNDEDVRRWETVLSPPILCDVLSKIGGWLCCMRLEQTVQLALRQVWHHYNHQHQQQQQHHQHHQPRSKSLKNTSSSGNIDASKQPEWLHFDDTKVKSLTSIEFQRKIVDSSYDSPYILFYVRCWFCAVYRYSILLEVFNVFSIYFSLIT